MRWNPCSGSYICIFFEKLHPWKPLRGNQSVIHPSASSLQHVNKSPWSFWLMICNSPPSPISHFSVFLTHFLIFDLPEIKPCLISFVMYSWQDYCWMMHTWSWLAGWLCTYMNCVVLLNGKAMGCAWKGCVFEWARVRWGTNMSLIFQVWLFILCAISPESK